MDIHHQNDMASAVPQSLRSWFLVHFVVDMVFAVPLMIAPEWSLSLMRFPVIDPFTTRLVAAALFGIGGVSYLVHKKGKETYVTMLLLKLIWSAAAVIGLVWTLISQPIFMGYVIAGIFAVFFCIWMYYYKMIK